MLIARVHLKTQPCPELTQGSGLLREVVGIGFVEENTSWVRPHVLCKGLVDARNASLVQTWFEAESCEMAASSMSS